MSPLKAAFRLVQPTLERGLQVVDREFSRFIQPRRARGKLLLQAYTGWGTPRRVELTGRVLLPRTMTPAQSGDPRWQNMQNILRRLLSREVGGMAVTGLLNGQCARAVSDMDGYFTLHFNLNAPLLPGWHEAALSLEGRSSRATARIQIIEHPRYGIISDLDDTVIQSDVTSLPRMLVTVLTENARTRLPFPGVGALYRALTRDDGERNPIFYVSSSPWNFFDLLVTFLHFRRIPLGPIFLRNWGADLLKSHGGYKHGVISRILSTFPALNFILIGDSGEQDPAIYAEIVRQHPGRILAVYIRDLTGAIRDAGIMKLRDEVRRAGVDLILTSDSLNAASHAMSAGFITPGEYRGVMQSVSGG